MIPELYSLTHAAGLVATGVASAAAGLFLLARGTSQTRRHTQRHRAETAFLFDGETLVDVSDSGQMLIDLTEPRGSDLARLVGLLSPQFPKLAEALPKISAGDAVTMPSVDDTTRLRLSRGPGGLRLRLQDCGEDDRHPAAERFSLVTLSSELQMHRLVGERTPFPVWRQSDSGQILWANAEFRALAERLGQMDTGVEGLKPIFSEDVPFDDNGPTIARSRLELPHQAEPKWFEFQVNRLGNDRLIAAIPVDRVVRAERSLNDFVQTLTQTFAHLNVGLAVFNRNRELALFNPALSDLLALSPEFLITRPTLTQLFDRLREKRMVPEPKDYKNWRRQMSALEAAAADSVHSETWSLVDGRTYRVTGRPHPEGAVAFLFEDISAEISSERKFRAKLQMGQAVIDGLSEAIAVFSPAGELVMSNRAYAKLWHGRASLDPAELSFVEASRSWQQKCAPTPVWGDARDFAATISERSNWTADVRMRDGRLLNCRFEPLAGGHTLVGFGASLGEIPAPVAIERSTISA